MFDELTLIDDVIFSSNLKFDPWTEVIQNYRPILPGLMQKAARIFS